MRVLIAAISFALALVVVTFPADAKRHARSGDSTSEIVKLKRELASARSDIRNVLDLLRSQPQALVGAFASAPIQFLDLKPPIVLASLNPPDVKVEPQAKDRVLRGVSTAGLPQPLKDIIWKIQSACGGSVISALRLGARVRGSGRPSLHGSWRAADITAPNPSCIYAVLRREKFPGGYSVDYARVHHTHLGYAPHGREWGSRFVHWQPHRQAHRYARRHGHRYARA